MHFVKFNRVAAGLVCGALVASSACVTAFAGEPKVINGQHCETRPIKVAEVPNGKIKVTGIENGEAYATTKITVELLPDAGYVAAPIINNDDYKTYFSTNSYADWHICEENGVYSFEMPWCDPSVGVTISANFVPAK